MFFSLVHPRPLYPLCSNISTSTLDVYREVGLFDVLISKLTEISSHHEESTTSSGISRGSVEVLNESNMERYFLLMNCLSLLLTENKYVCEACVFQNKG